MSEPPSNSPTADIPELPPDTGSSNPIATPKPIALGKFRLLALLGEGGMGKVIRAQDTTLQRQVALKCLKKSAAVAKSYRPEQFIREARAAAALEHPHIVQIYETGEAAGYYYIAMELVEGGSLASLVKACGPLDVGRACQLGAEAAEALAFASQHGITHRDIKPGNLMLSRSGRCKVADFGLAHIADPADGFAMPKNAVGTPAYIAPELLNGFPASAKSDVYSLACTMFFLLTGKTPFQSRDKAALLRMHLDMPPPSIASLRPDLPDSLAKVLARALSKNPDDRPGPDTFAKQLRAHTIPVGASQSMSISATGPFVPAPPAASGEATGNQPRTKKAMVVVLVAAAVIVVGIVIAVTIMGKSAPPPPVNSVAGNPASATPAVAAPTPASPTPGTAAAPAQPLAAAPEPTPAPAPTPTPTPAPTPAAAVPAAAVPGSAPDIFPPGPTIPRVSVAPQAAAPKSNARNNAPAGGNPVPVSDTAALRAAAQSHSTVTVTGTINSYSISTTGDRVATLTFADAPTFSLLIPARLFSPMTRKFGGKDGNGAEGKAIRFSGAPELNNDKLTMTLSTTSQIEPAP
ncbi:MAG TPA: protein kinase [Phycisphaerae bacterium]|nr:protein kinase [Phycisphaerae bacterium]